MNSNKTQIGFGKQVRDLFYNLDPNVAFLNHGSYGSSPKPVIDRKRKLQDEMESNPDLWFRLSLYENWLKNLSSLANYLKVDISNVLIGENATDCINVILKSIEFDGAKDAILTNSLEYGAVKNAIDYTSKYHRDKTDQVNIYSIDINFPITSKTQLVQLFDQACADIIVRKKLRLRLAVIDHITSGTALLMPIVEINQTIRRWAPTCKILVDGAHAIGQVKLDFKSYGCDYYVSNLHKWFFAPRSCSFIYTSDAKNFTDPFFQPCYISTSYGSSVLDNFCKRGTTDKTSWFVVDECIRFYEEYMGGYDPISTYCTTLINQALAMLEDAWKTKRLEISSELEAPLMKCIKLPYLKDYVIGPEPADQVVARLILDLLIKYRLVAVPVVISNELYIRLSCFVYNYLDEYVKLKEAILDLADPNHQETSNEDFGFEMIEKSHFEML